MWLYNQGCNREKLSKLRSDRSRLVGLGDYYNGGSNMLLFL